MVWDFRCAGGAGHGCSKGARPRSSTDSISWSSVVVGLMVPTPKDRPENREPEPDRGIVASPDAPCSSQAEFKQGRRG